MRNNRFQNHVSKSPFTLPLCIVLGFMVWFWNDLFGTLSFSFSSLLGFAFSALITYVVIETSNKFSLLRVRSNMIASVWVIAVALMPEVHDFSAGWVATLALVCSYYVMFHAYQQFEPVVAVFHAFLLLGIASLLVVHLLVFVPLFYWYLFVFLRSLTWRSFWAGIVGLVLPICFVLGWSIASRDYAFIMDRAGELSQTSWIVGQDYACMLSYRNPQILVLAFMFLLIFVGIVHYLSSYYSDKIRTRMYLYIYVIQTIVASMLILCIPSKIEVLYPVLMCGGSVMIAHFFAQTGSWLSNILFVVTMLMVIILLAVNLGIWKF